MKKDYFSSFSTRLLKEQINYCFFNNIKNVFHRRKTMKKIILVVSLLLVCTVFAFAEDTDKIIMRVGTIENINNLGAKAVDRFAAIMKEKSGGAFIVEPYHAAQLGETQEQLQQVKSGTLESFRGSISALGRFKGDMVISEFIYLFDSREQAEKVALGPTMNQINEQIAKEHGMRYVTASWTRLPRHILTKNPVRKIEDLRGMKIRVPDAKAYIESFKFMGATPTPVAFNETYLALKQGLVDGAENHVESLYNMKWYEVAKNLTLTYHSYDVTGFIVNQKWWDSVPDKYKKLFFEVDKEVNEWFIVELNKLQDEYINKMKAEGVTVWTVDIAPFKNAVIPAAALAVENEGFWEKGLFEKIQKELE